MSLNKTKVKMSFSWVCARHYTRHTRVHPIFLSIIIVTMSTNVLFSSHWMGFQLVTGITIPVTSHQIFCQPFIYLGKGSHWESRTSGQRMTSANDPGPPLVQIRITWKPTISNLNKTLWYNSFYSRRFHSKQ